MPEIVSSIAMMVIPAIVTWYLTKRKNLAEARQSEIESEVKAAEFYRSLLDDATVRLDKAIETINQQESKIKSLIEIIESRDKKIKELIETVNSQDIKIESLLKEVELLTDELRKYKQLNGKTQ